MSWGGSIEAIQPTGTLRDGREALLRMGLALPVYCNVRVMVYLGTCISHYIFTGLTWLGIQRGAPSKVLGMQHSSKDACMGRCCSVSVPQWMYL